MTDDTKSHHSASPWTYTYRHDEETMRSKYQKKKIGPIIRLTDELVDLYSLLQEFC